jgi:hypothetical protein
MFLEATAVRDLQSRTKLSRICNPKEARQNRRKLLKSVLKAVLSKKCPKRHVLLFSL